MRRLAALLLLLAACAVALLAWPLVALAGAIKGRADRLRGPTVPHVPDAITWAVIRAHEAELQAGRARWQ